MPNKGGTSISILPGLGNGTFGAEEVLSRPNATPSSVAAGDFDEDGRTDLVTTDIDNDTVTLLLAQADGSFASQTPVAVGDGPVTSAVADLNRDGNLDLAVANAGSGSVSVLLGTGGGSFQPQVAYAVGGVPIDLDIRDLDGDGNLDLIATNPAGESLSVLAGNGDGSFDAAVQFAAGSSPYATVLGDFNRDGRPDAAVANPLDDIVTVLLNGSTGTPPPPPPPAGPDVADGTTPIDVVTGTDPAAGTTERTFIDGAGATVVDTLDSQGRILTQVVTSTDGTVASTTFTYRPDGTFLQRTDFVSSAGSVTVNTEYGFRGPLETTVVVDGAFSSRSQTVYNPDGSVTRTTVSASEPGSRQYTFDGEGDLLRETYTAPDGTVTVVFPPPGDTTPPSGTLAADDPTVTTDATVQYTANFTEAVTGLDASDFAVFTTGTLTGVAVTGVTQISASLYTVDVSTGQGSGTFAISLAAAGSGVADLSGNALAADIGSPSYEVRPAVPQNRPPAASPDSASATALGDAVLGNVLANDSDPNRDALQVAAIQAVSGPPGPSRPVGPGGLLVEGAHGVLFVNPDGSYAYQPQSAGGDGFVYTVSDGRGGSSTATLGIGVAPGTPAAAAAFGFAFTEALVFSDNGHDYVVGPDGTVRDVTGVGTLTFTDGSIQQQDGSPLVDDLFYYARNLDVWAAHIDGRGVDADAHYFNGGWTEHRDPNAYFSTDGYLAANPDVAAAGVDPLTHFHNGGWAEGRDPGPGFDVELYRRDNPDVAAANIDPLFHFLNGGQIEGRAIHDAIGPARLFAANPASSFDAEYYLLSNPDIARAALAAGGATIAFAYDHYRNGGFAEGRDPNAFFDSAGYLNAYGDVATAGVDPLQHYGNGGYAEGRDPSGAFDTAGYLAANPDVAAAGIDPLRHFIAGGVYEGRVAVNDGVFAVPFG